jgi:YfiH family protein
MQLCKNGVAVIKYENTPKQVDCFVTTRNSGYSMGDYSFLNLSVNTKEDHKVALKNIELLKYAYGIDTLVNLYQVHGNKVFEVDKDNIHHVMFAEGDGLFTLERNIALSVLTADCYNVFLAGEKGICALHCGHKSVSSDIMSEGVRIFEKYDDFPVFAGIGPGISAKNYEVGKELADKFSSICPESVTEKDGSYRLCLRTVIEENLKAKGIKNIEHIRNCTYDDADLYSHRRDKGVTGRMMGVIVRR